MTEFRLNNRQWLAKLVAALVPGALLCFGGMALLGQLCHATGDIKSVLAQYMMLSAILGWLVVLGSCFLFRSGLWAWGVLGGGALVVWGLFAILAKVMMA